MGHKVINRRKEGIVSGKVTFPKEEEQGVGLMEIIFWGGVER